MQVSRSLSLGAHGAVAVACCRRCISTTSRAHMREMFRELKDMGFAPRFRDQHTRMMSE